MKQTLFATLTVIIILTACEKQKANEEIVTLRSTGFFCTIGINSISKQDTICLGSSSSGTSYDIDDYSHTAAAGGFIARPKDIWTLVTTGDNNWYLKNNAGKYLSFEDNPYVTNDEYGIDLNDSPNEKSVFVRNQNSGQNFYMESKYKRGYYLISRAANVYPPDPSHSSVRFQKTKQLWFFMP